MTDTSSFVTRDLGDALVAAALSELPRQRWSCSDDASGTALTLARQRHWSATAVRKALLSAAPSYAGGDLREKVDELARRLCNNFDARLIADQVEAPLFDDSEPHVQDYWRAVATAALSLIDPATIRRQALEEAVEAMRQRAIAAFQSAAIDHIASVDEWIWLVNRFAVLMGEAKADLLDATAIRSLEEAHKVGEG